MVEESDLQLPAADPKLWKLDPRCVFLNHGSFGSCPRAVLEHQQELRNRMEADPVQFLARDLEGLLDVSRHHLAQFVGAEPDQLVFVPNATSGVNAVLRSLRFETGDEIVVTNHEYNACRNVADYAAASSGAEIRMANIPFPVHSSEDIVEAVLAATTSRTRLVLIDHVTSQTALVFPLREIVSLLRSRNIECLVDGAHAPGMIPLNLQQLGAAYYTGNCHKWICAPKGVGFLYVRPGMEGPLRPVTISHGANTPRTDRARFLIEFAWPGTWDPTAALSVSTALTYMQGLHPQGWEGIMRRNHRLAVAAGHHLCRVLGRTAPVPEGLIGSMFPIPLPDSPPDDTPPSPLYGDAVQDALRAQWNIEVPVIPWPRKPKRILRISAQLYNSMPQYELLASSAKQLLAEEINPAK